MPSGIYPGNKGRIPWNKGKKDVYSKEMLGRMSLSKKGQIPWNTGKKRPEMTGEKHPRWKGGKITIYGYKYIKNRNHPFANKQGYVPEHRLIMEEHLGRYLKPEEIAHHINGNKLDNRIENLALCKNDSTHMKSFHPPIQLKKHWFKKGHITWNTGKHPDYMKGNQFAKGNKPNQTSFKKGHNPSKHKEGCKCFRCTKIPWDKSIHKVNTP